MGGSIEDDSTDDEAIESTANLIAEVAKESQGEDNPMGKQKRNQPKPRMRKRKKESVRKKNLNVRARWLWTKRLKRG